MKRLAAVLGWPISHSRSPAMHDAAFAACGVDAVMLPLAVRPERLDDAVRGLAAMDALGASVTVPHKEAVAGCCAALDPSARAVGAVNCLAFVDGRAIGHNTDAGGFVDGLRAAGHAAIARAVVLGGGGAARAVVVGLEQLGAEVVVVARRPDAVTWRAARPWSQLPALLATAGLIVDATSAALEPAADAALADAVPLAALPADAVVATLIYHRATALLAAARARGHAVLDGRAMLLYQATRAFTLWTGRAAPVEVMAAALAASLA